MDDITLRKLQLTELEILKHVHQVCSDNSITYYLVGGTLLGAIRHKGFIPWDDDLDIAMPRKDYIRFIDICSKGALGEDYYLHHTQTDKDYWLAFAKVKKNNTLFDENIYRDMQCNKGIFIDVFPLDFCNNNIGLHYNVKAKLIKKFSYIIQMRRLNKPSLGFSTTVFYWLTRMLPICTLSKLRDNICSSEKDGQYIINYGSNYKYQKQTMPKNYYEPAVLVPFEDSEFYAPHESIKYLEHLFQNWEHLPQEEERRNHNPSAIIFDLHKEGEHKN